MPNGEIWSHYCHSEILHLDGGIIDPAEIIKFYILWIENKSVSVSKLMKKE